MLEAKKKKIDEFGDQIEANWGERMADEVEIMDRWKEYFHLTYLTQNRIQ